MSLDTWRAVFYRKSARDTSSDEAIAHSLEKWRGLTAANLSQHGITRGSFGCLEDDAERFSIDTTTCALCVHFRKEEGEDYDWDDQADCSECPLAIARDGIPCDGNREGEKLSPYQVWTDLGDPQPMILWLTKAKAEGRHD